MAQITENFGFYLEDSGEAKFKEWREKINGPNNSNTVKMDEVLHELDITKQNTLTGQPGQVVGFDGMGLAYAVRGWSNPNLLDNWYFADPVNQKGLTKYTGAGYTIDRWAIDIGEDVSIIDGGIRITCTASTGRSFRQVVDAVLTGKTITASILVSDVSAGSSSVVIIGNLATNSILRSMQIDAPGLYSVTITVPDTVTTVYIQFDPSAVNGTLDVIAAKLELGDQQTLAHQDANGNWVLNDPPPNKALELLKCQRYQLILPILAKGQNTSPIGYGFSLNTNSIRILIPTPVAMRTNPTIAFLAGNITDVDLFCAGVTIPGITITGITSITALQYGVSIVFAVEGAIHGQPCIMRTPTATILLDANR